MIARKTAAAVAFAVLLHASIGRAAEGGATEPRGDASRLRAGVPHRRDPASKAPKKAPAIKHTRPSHHHVDELELPQLG